MASDLALPFEGLPTTWAILFYFAFLIIVAILIWTFVLFVRAEQWLKRTTLKPRSLQRESDWMWVFLVPALNEEMTIRDSVDRLLQVNAQRKLILVINDGSDDATGEVLDSFAASELQVITRIAPDARKGKAAALNHAYTQLGPILEERGIPREKVIATVVDADGRLDPHSPSQVARHFEDPKIGGVQVLVRIYNRQKLLTWMQDIEFGIFDSAAEPEVVGNPARLCDTERYDSVKHEAAAHHFPAGLKIGACECLAR